MIWERFFLKISNDRKQYFLFSLRNTKSRRRWDNCSCSLMGSLAPLSLKQIKRMLKMKRISISPCQCFICKFLLSYEEKPINVNNICRRSNTNITVSENRDIYNAEAENAWEGKTSFQQGFLKSYSNSVVERSRRETGWACSCRNLNSMKVIILANLETWQKEQGKHGKRPSWWGFLPRSACVTQDVSCTCVWAFRLGREEGF